jgi:spore germination protein
VAEGESLWVVAVRYQTSVDEIARLNGLEDPDKLAIGDRLSIPG